MRKAWLIIHANGLSSESVTTRNEVRAFAEDSDRHIQRIARQLQQRNFKFAPSRGIPVKKKGKTSKRPLVKSPLPNRIVQRAILDVLQSLPRIKSILGSKHNFGGIESAGVPEAIRHAYIAAQEAKYFIRTDIKSFFVNIPRSKAIEIVTRITHEAEFDALLVQATDTELDNLIQLGRDSELFPLEGKGVAQGSCLSPLLCNLLLGAFDEQMNGRGIRCIRYIDDFIIFAKSKSTAFAALNSAREALSALDLDAYDPQTDKDKADCGSTAEAISFLGCEVLPGKIKPSRESTHRLLTRVDGILRDATYGALDVSVAVTEHFTYADTLHKLGNTIRGWGNTYSFCTDDRQMANVDIEIDKKLASFQLNYFKRLEKKSEHDKRTLLGVHMLKDCKRDQSFRAMVAGYPTVETPAQMN